MITVQGVVYIMVGMRGADSQGREGEGEREGGMWRGSEGYGGREAGREEERGRGDRVGMERTWGKVEERRRTGGYGGGGGERMGVSLGREGEGRI